MAHPELPFDLTDRTARLVAADWLDDRGRSHEARILRTDLPVRVLSPKTAPRVAERFTRSEFCKVRRVRSRSIWARHPRSFAARVEALPAGTWESSDTLTLVDLIDG